MKTPDLPEEKPSAPSKRDCTSTQLLADSPAATRLAKGAARKARIKGLIVSLAVWGAIPASFATWLIQRAEMKDE